MSASQVAYIHLACDSCGKTRKQPIKGATAARLAAAAEGWKYAEWDVKGLNKYSTYESANGYRRKEATKIVPRTWDACPDCTLPDGPEEAYDMREKRKAGAS